MVPVRLEQLERRFDEERRQWQTEKQDWQKEKQDWQKERREWQRQIGQSESLTRQMQRQIISMQYKVHVLEAGANTRKSTTPRTPQVFSQGAISSKKLRKTSQKRHDRHVLARSDDVNPLEFVVSQMGQRLRQVTAEVQSLKNALEQDVNKMGQNINEVKAVVQSLKNVLQMGQNLSKVAAEVQSLKNILESEVSKMSQNLSRTRPSSRRGPPPSCAGVAPSARVPQNWCTPVSQEALGTMTVVQLPPPSVCH